MPLYNPVVNILKDKNYAKEKSQKEYTEVMSKEKLLKALGNDYTIIDFNGNEIGD